ncbi:Predicted arabinose efflux permease, MFS family [Stigmatella aurantiaca]|uniref:Predicted arabinose efflux permease, MFS family n=1 Tax=Stigmatella aurantiaca TaxID=41 RepID=A0A1H7VY92_STIAU|nr:MFS transporter [Stigmatella aurantiaca]SEM14223.1 Predicted arabinose efflux permease, MFS family [Stigmatella aurantiaca]
MTLATVPSGVRPLYSNRYKAGVLGLLLATYTFNFVDRTIISTLGQAIKLDLRISDTQLGLLSGLYFALLYTFLGIPVARLAERWNRVTIISLSLVIWSGFTALCGSAANFAQLALYRFGVGVGEAGCSPPSHSLISDYYEPRKRASALAVYSFGIPLGTLFGAVIGGWLAQEFSWRVAFVIVGLPGVLLGVVLKLAVQEPPRGHSEPAARPSALPPFSLAQEFRELGAVAKTLFGTWPVLHTVLGVTLASFGSYGSGAFAPPYFVRGFGLSLTQVGMIVGLAAGVSAGVGTLVGGFVTDWAVRRSTIWYALIPAIGLMVCAPIYITAYLQTDWKMAAAILLIPGLFHYVYLGPTFSVVQNSVEPHRRATATALLFFVLNLIALGGGPVFTGWLIDRLAQFHFNHEHVTGLLPSLTGAFGAPEGASFLAACPGGTAPQDAAAGLVQACQGALARATQQGILVTLCFYVWAGLHYALAAIGMVRHMKARAVA